MKVPLVIWIFFYVGIYVVSIRKGDVTSRNTKATILSPHHTKRTVVSSPEGSTDEDEDKAKHLIFDMSLAQIASKYNMKHLQELIARTKVEGNGGERKEAGDEVVKTNEQREKKTGKDHKEKRTGDKGDTDDTNDSKTKAGHSRDSNSNKETSTTTRSSDIRNDTEGLNTTSNNEEDLSVETKSKMTGSASPKDASVNNSNTTTTVTKKEDTAKTDVCENCLTNCSDLVKSVTSLHDLSSLPLESKVLPHLLTCYYGIHSNNNNNNNNTNNNDTTEGLHTASLLHKDEEGDHHPGDSSGTGVEMASKNKIQEILQRMSEMPSTKSRETESNDSSKSKSNRSTAKSNRSIIRTKSGINKIQKKDSVSEASILKTISGLKEREGYMNILSSVDALLKDPDIRKRGEKPERSDGDDKDRNDKENRVGEEDFAKKKEVAKDEMNEERWKGEDENIAKKKRVDKEEQKSEDWDDLEREKDEDHQSSDKKNDHTKLNETDAREEKEQSKEEEKTSKNNKESRSNNDLKEDSNKNKDVKDKTEKFEITEEEGSGFSARHHSSSRSHGGVGDHDQDKEDGTAFVHAQGTEVPHKRHDKDLIRDEDRKGSHEKDGPNLSGDKQESNYLKTNHLRETSETKEIKEAENSFKIQNLDASKESNKKNEVIKQNDDPKETVTKESISHISAKEGKENAGTNTGDNNDSKSTRTNIGENNEGTKILTAQLNTQITDLENKLIQQKLSEELRQFTAAQNPPNPTGPTTSEILNFEKNLEKTIDYDPELRNLEQGIKGGKHDYLIFNSGRSAFKEAEKDKSLYGELQKTADGINSFEKDTTAKLLAMYSSKFPGREASISKFDDPVGGPGRSRFVDRDSSLSEEVGRSTSTEKDTSELMDRDTPPSNSDLEREKAQPTENESAKDIEYHKAQYFSRPHRVNFEEDELPRGRILDNEAATAADDAPHREFISTKKIASIRDDPNKAVKQYSHSASNRYPPQNNGREHDAEMMAQRTNALLERYTNLDGRRPEGGEEEPNLNYINDLNYPSANPSLLNGVVGKDNFESAAPIPSVDPSVASALTGKDNESTATSPSVPSGLMGRDSSENAGKESESSKTKGSIPASNNSSTAAPTFSYDPDSPYGPDSWQRINPDWTCKGRKQSPINIETDSISSQQLIRNIMLKSTKKNANTITGVLKNNGHAPTISLSSESNGVKLFGGNLNGNYYLKQLHFHFGCNSSLGSEHHIDGKAFPVELHLVFWDNSTYSSFSEAAKSDRGIAVIAVLYALSSTSKGQTDPLTQISKILRHVENQGDSIKIYPEDDIRLEDLVPNLMSSDHAGKFYTYEGSLSSPGCYETVTWIVIASQPAVTEEQLESFRTLKSSLSNKTQRMCNNFRPVQPTNGRKIFSNII